MIRGATHNPGYEAIPDENIEEPLDFYNPLINENMSKLLKPGTKVVAESTRLGHGKEQGILSKVDEEDTRTIFPYYIDFGTRSGWYKESEIVEVIPVDNAPNFILGCVICLLFFWAACAGCNPSLAQTNRHARRYHNHGSRVGFPNQGRIPAHYGKGRGCK